ncbi:MAG: biotin--[acetyl-CoA-carboxylase] ligase [Candidatus Zapsychrus exili]|nr:biotin--[acetyl-CoA-carboxylase] ligase [Candidatus Zapsychrus exili]
MKDKIIDLLKYNGNFCSGEEISRIVKISRSAIWKHISELRDMGYVIEAASHKGYHLKSSPDKLLGWEVNWDFPAKYLGKRVVYAEELPSTMDLAFEFAQKGAEEGTAVCTDKQTKGRGRMQRNWSSVKSKGIYASIILRPKIAPQESSLLTLIAGICVCEAIREVADLKAFIKWPNDVLVGNKKIAGILTEMNAEMDSIKFIVIGIGINVSNTSFPKDIEATSVYLEGRKDITKVALFKQVLQRLEFWYEIFLSGDKDKIINRWRELSMTLGKQIILRDVSGDIKGKALDIDSYGGLVIKTEEGNIIKRMSGDIVYN